MRLYSPPKAAGAPHQPPPPPGLHPLHPLHLLPFYLPIGNLLLRLSWSVPRKGGGEGAAGTGAPQAGSSSRLLREGTGSLAPSLRSQVPLKGGSMTTRGSPSSSRGPHRPGALPALEPSGATPPPGPPGPTRQPALPHQPSPPLRRPAPAIVRVWDRKRKGGLLALE